jgi:ABC-type dipeptide/oligopeptide/nickel transport system permease subunit
MSATLAADSPSAFGLRRFRRDWLSIACTMLVATIALSAALAPVVAPHDPGDSDLLRRLQPPAWLEGGEWSFPLGCDALGRDLLSRLLFGARISLGVGFSVVAASTIAGIVLGLFAGYVRGWADAVLSRAADILLGFPYLVFAIGLMGMMGPGLSNIVITLIAKEWVVPYRVVRGETLGAREQDYVEAARAIGCRPWRIMRGEILPNILSPVLVVATIRMAHIIVMEASLSFLGLGVEADAFRLDHARRVHQAEDAEEGDAFARAGLADHAEALARPYIEIDAVHRTDHAGMGGEARAKSAHGQQRFRAAHRASRGSNASRNPWLATLLPSTTSRTSPRPCAARMPAWTRSLSTSFSAIAKPMSE